MGSNPTLSAIKSRDLLVSDGDGITFGSAPANRKIFRAASDHMSKLNLSQALIVIAVICTGFLTCADAQRRRRSMIHATICGNPKISCKTIATFQPNDLPFQVPKNAIIVDTEPFYAIILQSMAVNVDSCDVFIPEHDRLAAQAVFPEHKVFTSRCTDPENLFYLDLSAHKSTNISETRRIMAVYAGQTLADANRMLTAVKATGKFSGANIRRMRTGFNGT